MAQTLRRAQPATGLLSDYNGITRLEAEPQEGPTEYKLHLLLRPRRKYEHSSTSTAKICGSTQSRPLPYDPTSNSLRGTPVSVGGSSGATTTRQDRFEHLTTQLLWRLQQSCPYHASSAAVDLVIPKLPDPDELARDGNVKLGKLLPGLEASRGALYEIGVADDGTLVGLTRDELDESLVNLRVMAASLGCNMNVLRMVIVGECEWIDSSVESEGSLFGEPQETRRKDKLWVVEALIMPDLTAQATGGGAVSSALSIMKQGPLTANQLRVTLTGPTTSGKSTLLGILSQGTLDNGRGKSRLNLLKHPHEVASGVTSSVAQALVGYNEGEIINDAHSGVESWIDAHDFTKDGRLVYLVDSAGAPRYRRTILRGIIGWAPHWTLLCIAADGSDASPAVDAPSLGTTSTGSSSSIDLASAHLELCLRLKLPLAIIITKLDLASKPSILSTLNKVLTGIKRAGRAPAILKAGATTPHELTHVSPTEEAAVAKVADQLASNGGDFLSVVPIVLTSAVDGRGLGMLHALLQGLPLPPTPTAHDFTGPALNPEQPASLFHIEDQYNLAASSSLATGDSDEETDLGTVVAGHLRFGSLSIGDTVVVGPFPSSSSTSSSSDETSDTPSPATPSLGAVGAIASDNHLRPTLSDLEANPSSAELNRLNSSTKTNPSASASSAKGEWHTAKVVSIRNLQLPVQTLAAGQVGSIGMVFDHPTATEAGAKRTARVRKGMVLAVPGKHMSSTTTLQAASGLTAVFEDDDCSPNGSSSSGDGNADEEGGVAAALIVGSLVNVYVASIRASARVVRVTRLHPTPSPLSTHTSVNEPSGKEEDDVFTFGDDVNDTSNNGETVDSGHVGEEEEEAAKKGCEVQLELLSNREWIELGSRILILGDNGSRDRSSRLEGFVGRVVEIVE
ncbi:hypothetical protein B0T09DRAFT_359684 [Sordaria sp. MPI-SDFR-AT-0083]|nr:hypothetical protein B0T09DRAFT_359684 [Sordaria sp. MPI-SDFR-AT-0083]